LLIDVFDNYWGCSVFVPNKILLLLVILWVMNTYPSASTAIPDEQQVVSGYLFTQSLNVRFVV
jgi:hypothetical protein